MLCENLLFMKSAPEWIREPSWRFIDDQAMVFIDQIEFSDMKPLIKISRRVMFYMFFLVRKRWMMAGKWLLKW